MKKSFKFSLIFFVLITLWKWFSTSKIQWLENIILTIGVTLVSTFVDWASKPLEYKKRSD
ncbi:hypothetical protein SporoS204_01660 [Sporosarcina ureae]|uniref:Holin n=1 Tax=Sporosarcina ureae TaxID=1571 RepID=A0ABM6JSM7_SPOUR|nr:hypothetical protein SporoS204_01660 [Sporosarcina ureae]